MGEHVVNESSIKNVYWMSSCNPESQIGKLYIGEVFTFRKRNVGYANVKEICFRNSEGKYVEGFIDQPTYGSLHLYGNKVNEDKLGSCYRFKLRSSLVVVDDSNNIKSVLAVGDYIYTTSSTCGQTEPRNLKIIGYRKSGASTVAFNGFVKLNYEANGSMLAKNFCIYKS